MMSVDNACLNIRTTPVNLWSFSGANMDISVYMGRAQLVSGDFGNGLELRRKLHMECGVV